MLTWIKIASKDGEETIHCGYTGPGERCLATINQTKDGLTDAEVEGIKREVDKIAERSQEYRDRAKKAKSRIKTYKVRRGI